MKTSLQLIFLFAGYARQTHGHEGFYNTGKNVEHCAFTNIGVITEHAKRTWTINGAAAYFASGGDQQTTLGNCATALHPNDGLSRPLNVSIFLLQPTGREIALSMYISWIASEINVQLVHLKATISGSIAAQTGQFNPSGSYQWYGMVYANATQEDLQAWGTEFTVTLGLELVYLNVTHWDSKTGVSCNQPRLNLLIPADNAGKMYHPYSYTDYD